VYLEGTPTSKHMRSPGHRTAPRSLRRPAVGEAIMPGASWKRLCYLLSASLAFRHTLAPGSQPAQAVAYHPGPARLRGRGRAGPPGPARHSAPRPRVRGTRAYWDATSRSQYRLTALLHMSSRVGCRASWCTRCRRRWYRSSTSPPLAYALGDRRWVPRPSVPTAPTIRGRRLDDGASSGAPHAAAHHGRNTWLPENRTAPGRRCRARPARQSGMHSATRAGAPAPCPRWRAGPHTSGANV
jgi:hypothetical protein